MHITGMRTRRCYLLSFLGALGVLVGVLAVAPSTQAGVLPVPPPPSIDKECTPNPVQVGGEIICTIDLVAAPGTVAVEIEVTDTFPAGLAVTGATGQLLLNGQPFNQTAPCEEADNTVTCEIPSLLNAGLMITFEATIEAIAEQCGTFQNTATATGEVLFFEQDETLRPFTVADTEEITVEGCEVPPAPGQQQQGSPAPITQDFEQDSESGEIDQTFDIS